MHANWHFSVEKRKKGRGRDMFKAVLNQGRDKQGADGYDLRESLLVIT